MNTTNPNLDVRAPAGAVSVGNWRLNGGRARSFRGTGRTIQTGDGPEILVDIAGDQGADGRVTRRIWINGNICLAASDARQMARTLIATADECDWLSDAGARVDR
jgi:hypothetical protein